MTASAAPTIDLPVHGASSKAPAAPATNFLRHVIDHDLARGAYAARLGVPHRATGLAHGLHSNAIDRALVADPARVRTRFPPEPNGYLHIGHAKSICLNFGLAKDYDGVCHLRFDDTNPEKEDVEYVDAIIEMVRWLGFDWDAKAFEREAAHSSPTSAPDHRDDVEDHLYFASEYFELLYEFAEYLIRTGHAYVDSQTPDEMRTMRGTLVEPGRDSPHRTRTVDENLTLFRMMRAGDFPDGAHVLRARIDMASPNMNLRDPVLYRIRHAHHHRTGDAWCIYPMYDYTHCVSDALENITHSICTLEFEDHRPLYDWALERIVPVLRAPQFMHAIDRVRSLREQGLEAQKEFAIHCHNFRHKLFASPEEASMHALFDRWDHDRDAVLRDLDAFFELLLGAPEQFAPLLTHALEEAEGFGIPNPFGLPHQYEFSRLNLTYVITSKRKLKQLVDEGHVDGWDDPRMPTLVGLRRRGYTPASIRLLCERGGVSKSNSWTDYAELDQALRDDLDPKAARAFAILDPIRLVVTNYAEGESQTCTAPVHPHAPERGVRTFPFTRTLMIEREDFQETPQKGFFRLSPPTADKPGSTVRLKYGYVVRCTGFTKDADGRVVEVTCEYLPDTFSGTPGADAVKVKGNIAWISAAHAQAAEVRLYDRLFAEAQPDAGGRDFLQAINPDSKRVVTGYVEPGIMAAPEAAFQFERLGYFVADRIDSTVERPVFNRIATLRDTWQR
jgi:glutaminyl-tRNA synthetase